MRALLSSAVEHVEQLDVLGSEGPQHLGLVLRDEQQGHEHGEQQEGNDESDAVSIHTPCCRVRISCSAPTWLTTWCSSWTRVPGARGCDARNLICPHL